MSSVLDESLAPPQNDAAARAVPQAGARLRLLSRPGEWLLVLAALGLLVGWPFVRLLYEALRTPDVVGHLWTDPEVIRAIRGTLVTAAGAMAFALIVGAGAAIAFDRLRPAGHRALTAGLLLPVLVPPFVGALSVTQAYTAAGLTDHLIGLHMDWLFGAAGTTLVLGVQQVPLAYLITAAALRTRGGADLERAARASGANAFTTFRTVTMPLLRPALLAAAALCFISAASDFGVPAVLAIPARYSTIATEIYRAMSFSSDGLADPISLSALLVVAALLILGVTSRFNRGSAMPARGQARIERRRGPAAYATTTVLTCYILIASIIPLVGLAAVAITKIYGESPVPSHWSTNHLSDVLDSATTAAFGRSLALAAIVASILAVAGVLAGRVGLRRGGRFLGALIAVPYAVPGSAVAVAILLTFGRWLYGGLVIIAVAYLARFWALAQQPIGAALSQVGVDPGRAARASGASALRAWWVSVWPAIRPSVLAGWLLVFLSCLHELTVSVLLYVPGKETIGVVVLNAEQGGDLASTSAIALILTVVVLLCAVPLVAFRRLRGALGFSAGGTW